MSNALLTDRLAVIGQTRLKQTFSSCLEFALKSVTGLSDERRLELLSVVKEFHSKPDVYIQFRKFCMSSENINIWIECLSDGVYSFTLQKQLCPRIQYALENKEIQLEDLWHIYLYIYARKLLRLGARTLNHIPNGFSPQNVRSYLANLPTIHGSELINDIPPLLEKGYISLNNCGENQQTEWHRKTFMDSYFMALKSYYNIFGKNEIARAFHQIKA